MTGSGARLALALGTLALLVAAAGVSPARAGEGLSATLDQEIEALGLEALGVEWGIAIWRAGQGFLYQRNAQVPRSAASAIKSIIALDLILTRRESLDHVLRDVPGLLRTHPAFRKFTEAQREETADALVGRSYLQLAGIMMGRVPIDDSVVYNAACNVIMIKLGGPDAIRGRIQNLNSYFSGIDINRYMENWDGDGDNRATPQALAALYAMVASGSVPGLDPEGLAIFRALMLDEGNGGPGSIFEKAGTLYPKPMVRVHAGYVSDEGGDLVYAVMAEIVAPQASGGEDVFIKLMSAVDAVTLVCREIPTLVGD